MRWLGVALLLVVALLVALVLWVEFEPAAAPPPPPAASDRPAPTTTKHDRVARTERPSTDEPLPTDPDEEPTTTALEITRPVHRIVVRNAAGDPVAGFPLRLFGAEAADGVRHVQDLPFTDATGLLPVHFDDLTEDAASPAAHIPMTDEVHELTGDETVIVVDSGPAIEGRFYDATTGRDVPGGEIRVRGARLGCAEDGVLHRLAHTGLTRGDWEPFVLETEAPDGWALVHQRPSGIGVHIGLAVNVVDVRVPVVPGLSASVTVKRPDGTGVEGAVLVGVFDPGGHSPLDSLIRRDVLRDPPEGGERPMSDATGRIELPNLIASFPQRLSAAVAVDGGIYVSKLVELGGGATRRPVTFEVVVGTNVLRGAGGTFGSGFDLGTGRVTFEPSTGEETGEATLYVSVRRHDGSPLPFALVYVDGAAQARTDASGQARLTALPAGTQRVVVSEPGFPLTTRTVEFEDGASTSVEIVAESPRRLRVRVVDEHGDPLPGADVVLRAYGDLPFVHIEGDRQFLSAFTDPQGRLELVGVPHQRADVDVRWGPLRKTVPMARGATELEVVLTHRDR